MRNRCEIDIYVEFFNIPTNSDVIKWILILSASTLLAKRFSLANIYPFAELPEIGTVATEILANYAIRNLEVVNGQLVGDRFWQKEANGEVVLVDERRYRVVNVFVDADSEEYKADPQDFRRLQAYCRGKNLCLSFKTYNLSEEIVAFIDKNAVNRLILKTDFLSNVQSTVKLLPILKKIVHKRTLYWIRIDGDHNDVSFGSMLLELWKQEQFGCAVYPLLHTSILRDLVVAWHENSKQMSGKRFEFGRLDKVVNHHQWGFREATEDEKRYLRKYLPLAFKYCYAESPKHVWFMKNENGGQMFWLERKNASLLSNF